MVFMGELQGKKNNKKLLTKVQRIPNWLSWRQMLMLYNSSTVRLYSRTIIRNTLTNLSLAQKKGKWWFLKSKSGLNQIEIIWHDFINVIYAKKKQKKKKLIEVKQFFKEKWLERLIVSCPKDLTALLVARRGRGGADSQSFQLLLPLNSALTQCIYIISSGINKVFSMWFILIPQTSTVCKEQGWKLVSDAWESIPATTGQN